MDDTIEEHSEKSSEKEKKNDDEEEQIDLLAKELAENEGDVEKEDNQSEKSLILSTSNSQTSQTTQGSPKIVIVSNTNASQTNETPKTPKKRGQKRKASSIESTPSKNTETKRVVKKLKKMTIDNSEGLLEEGKKLMDLQKNHFIFETSMHINRLMHYKTPELLRVREFDNEFCKGLQQRMRVNPNSNVAPIVDVVIGIFFFKFCIRNFFYNKTL